ncbi:MAG: M48 family peptidase [Bacteroidetes bacterium]|nr:MAG: M48 family peptidase [Bacteroidota bacterium]
MTAAWLLWLILGILLIDTLFEQLLSWLNLRHHRPELPAAFVGQLDPDKYARSVDYHRANYRLGTFQTLLSFPLIFLLIAMGGLGWLDTQLWTVTDRPLVHALSFFGVLMFAGDLLGLPFQWYRTFQIEGAFGFNKTTPRTFWIDKLKGWAVSLVVGGIVLSVLISLIGWLGQNFWLWFWLFISLFLLLVNIFYTTVLLPLFNKLEPLEDGPLRQQIEAYAAKVAFPLTHVYVMDGSRRSTKANAFFSGLGRRKKVVLYDTLIEQHSPEELVAVLAHEIGHYKKRHIIQSLVISVLHMGVLLFLLSRFVESPLLTEALGGTGTSLPLNLIAFGLLYSPVSTLLGIGMNVFSRKNEYEADQYAAETYAAAPLSSALIRLHGETLSNLTPHPWQVFVHYSHPPLVQRLEALQGGSVASAS